MTQRQTSRSRVLRRAGAALAAVIAVTTVASTASAATKPRASKYGGTAKVAIFDTFAGWCFANNNANSSLMAVRTVYETLFEKTIGGDLVGLLAEKAVPSTDLKTWTITLRKGIKFHDGTDLTPEVVYNNLYYASGQKSAALATAGAAKKATWATATYTAMAGSAALKPLLAGIGITKFTAADATTNVQTVAFYGAIGTFAKGGALDKAAGGALDAAGLTTMPDLDWYASTYQLSTATAFIGNVKTIAYDNAASTVTLTLDRAQNDVPGMLYASGRFFIRGSAQFTSGKDRCSTGRPIGTGPFKTADNYTLSDTNTLSVVKNADYWRTDPKTGDKLPYLDGITFTNVKEGSQRAAAVRKGTYDIGQFSSAGDSTYIKDLRKRKSLVTEYKSPAEYYPSLWLNQGKTGSPFASLNARLAVLSCIDRANYVKVRTKGENVVATSLVGPKSVMYSTRGFQKFDVEASKAYVTAWQAEAGNAGKTLTFSFPADTSSQALANAQFFQAQWAKCGITANIVSEESAQIIAKAFNSTATGAAQNAYDAIFILLFEGTDVSFNLPFVLTSAFPATSTVPQKIWNAAVGTVLGLNHHSDTTIDSDFYQGQATSNPTAAKLKFQGGTAQLQTKGFMTTVSYMYYTMFVNKKNGLTNIGKVQLAKGKTQRIVTNWGIDWAGVQKKSS